MEKESGASIRHCMRRGLILGKFMPLHNGHIGLIEFALQYCDRLTVLLCHHDGEPINGGIREAWLHKVFGKEKRIRIESFYYDPAQLTDSSVPSRTSALEWAAVIKNMLPGISIVFTSEPYGNYVAEALGIEHRIFDEARQLFPVSATMIRQYPFRHWEQMPAVVRSYFVKTVCITGSESTGKSTLCGQLAHAFKTTFVPEAARSFMGHTQECTYEMLMEIAVAHANSILEKKTMANKVLFLDTDIFVTKSYARHLFRKELVVPGWVMEANASALHIFLETDAPFVQDGTRLARSEREILGQSHKKILQEHRIPFHTITGPEWDQRTDIAIDLVRRSFFADPC